MSLYHRKPVDELLRLLCVSIGAHDTVCLRRHARQTHVRPYPHRTNIPRYTR